MAKKNRAFERMHKKEVEELSFPIVVDGQPSQLVVQMNFNTARGTYQIVTKITTKQVDPANDAVNEATLTTVGNMLTQAIEEMKEKRRNWLSNKEPDDPDQLGLPLTGMEGEAAKG